MKLYIKEKVFKVLHLTRQQDRRIPLVRCKAANRVLPA